MLYDKGETKKRAKQRTWDKRRRKIGEFITVSKPVMKRIFVLFLILAIALPQLQVVQQAYADEIEGTPGGGEVSGNGVEEGSGEEVGGSGEEGSGEEVGGSGEEGGGGEEGGNGEEVSIGSGEVSGNGVEEGGSGEVSGNGIEEGNSQETEYISVSGQIVFMGNAESGIDSVKMVLYQNGEKVEDAEAQIQDGESYQGFSAWDFSFDDLPETDEDGDAYEYSFTDGNYSSGGQDLYYINGGSIAATGGSLCFDAGTTLVYVGRGDITGEYLIEKNDEDEGPPDEMVIISYSTVGGEENSYSDLARGSGVSSENGQWWLSDCLQYNPLSGEKIEYRVQVDGNADDYLAYYENVSPYEGEWEYLCEGGRLINCYFGDSGMLMMGILGASGGPQPGAMQASTEKVNYKVTVNWNDNDEALYDEETNPDGRISVELVLQYKMDGMTGFADLTPEILESWFVDSADFTIDADNNIVTPTPDMTAYNNWVYTYNLPKALMEVPDIDGNGKETYQGEQQAVKNIIYSFRLKDTSKSKLEQNYFVDEQTNNNIIINTKKAKMTFTKAWKDSSNEYLTRQDVEVLKSNLTLYRMVSGDASGKPVTESFSMGVTGETGDNWTFTISELSLYDPSGLPYIYYVRETDNKMTINASQTTLTDKTNVFYAATYSNVGNHAADQEACYDGGKIINTLTDYIDYQATKEWRDGVTDDDKTPEAEAVRNARPKYTLILMRYLGSDSNGYQHGTPVQGMRFSPSEAITTYPISFKTLSKYTSDFPKGFPRFDEEGREYTYYVQEVLNNKAGGATYEKRFYASATSNDFSTANALYNGGVLRNVRVGTMDIPVTKSWKAVAMQDMKASVDLQLNRKDSAGKWEVAATYKLGGFRAEVMEQTHTFKNLAKYDGNGEAYTYSVSELGITVNEKTPIKYEDITLSNGDKARKCEVDGHYFVMEETTDDDGNILLINRLVGTTDVKVKKVWNGLKTGDSSPPAITFQLYKDNKKEGSTTSIDVGVSVYPSPNPKTVNETDVWTSTWVVFEDMPRYDADGKEIEYNVKEVAVPGYSTVITSSKYEETAPLKGIVETTISNTPVGEGKWIMITKKWQDDGDENCRGPVTVALYHRTDVDEPWEEDAVSTVVLNKENNWQNWIRLSADDGFGRYDEDYAHYYVKEDSVARDSVSYDVEYDASVPYPDLASAIGEDNAVQVGTLETDAHFYNVAAYITKPTRKDKNNVDYIAVDYTFVNTRYGTVNMDLEKGWIDDKYQKDKVNQTVTLKVERTDTKTKVTDTVATVTLNGETAPYAVPSGLISGVTLDTSKTEAFKTRLTGFPKYNKKGELYLYAVKETNVKEGDGTGLNSHDVIDNSYRLVDGQRYSVSVGVEAAWGEHEDKPPSPDEMHYAVTNSRSETVPFIIYKVWKDITRTKNVSAEEILMETKIRPDIYLTLWSQVEGETAEKRVGNRYVERVWDTTQSDYYWICDFGSLPRYTADGKEILYWVVEDDPPSDSEYIAPQYYSQKPVQAYRDDPQLSSILNTEAEVTKIYNVSEANRKTIGGTYKGASNGETIVNQRKADRYLKGFKIWRNIPTNMAPSYYPDITVDLKIYQYDNATYAYVDAGYDAVILKEGQKEFFFGAKDTQLPKYDEYGTIIKYRAEETSTTPPKGYKTPVYDEYNLQIINAYKSQSELGADEMVQIDITKTWKNIPAGLTGDKIPKTTIQLWRYLTDEKGAEITDSAEDTKLSAEFTWTANETKSAAASFEKLPRYGYNGNEFKYFVKELLNGYDIEVIKTPDTVKNAKDEDVERITFDVTNDYNGATDGTAFIKLGGTKVWTGDSSDGFGFRPSEVKLKVYRSITGIADSTEEITSKVDVVWANTDSDNWSYSVYCKGGDYLYGVAKTEANDGATLCRYAPNGSAYIYYVEELKTTGLGFYTPSPVTGSKVTDIGDSGSLTLKGIADTATGNITASFRNTMVSTDYKVTKEWWKKEGSKQAVEMEAADMDIMLPASITLKIQYKPAPNAAWTDFTVADKTLLKADIKKLLLGSTDEHITKAITFTNLPKYGTYEDATDSGKEKEYEIPYRAIETHIGTTAITGNADGYTYAANADYTALKNTVETIPLTIRKEWIDSDNQDGVRPTSITFTVERDGDDKQTITVPISPSTPGADGEWKTGVTISVPKITRTEGNVAAVYRVTENLTDPEKGEYTLEGAAKDSYTQSTFTVGTGNEQIFTLINRHGDKKIDIQVTKAWSDASIGETIGLGTGNANQDAIRSGSVQVYLMRRDTKNDPWQYLKANGDYSILKADAELITLSAAANNWIHTWQDLQARWNSTNGASGAQKYYEYQVGEEPIKGYTASPTPAIITENETDNANLGKITLTNVLKKTSLDVEKVWDTGSSGANPFAGELPIKVKLQYRLGATGTWTDAAGTKAVQELKDGKKTYTYSGLPIENNVGTAYFYRVVESEINGVATGSGVYPGSYENTVQWAAAGETKDIITNTLKTRNSITVTKIWDDAGDQDGKRPGDKKVKVTLTKDAGVTGETISQTVDLTENAGVWSSYTWNNLPKYRNDGTTLCVYTLAETVPSGYTVTYSIDNGTTYSPSIATGSSPIPDQAGAKVIVKNSYTPKVMAVTATKIWDDDNNAYNTRPATVKLLLKSTLNSDGKTGAAAVQLPAGQNPAEISKSSSPTAWKHTWSNLPVYKSAGQKIYYSVVEVDAAGNEVALPSYLSPVYTKNSSSTGDDIEVTVTNKLDTVNLDIEKKWDDYRNIYNSRPANVTFTVQRKVGTGAWTNVTSGTGTITRTLVSDCQTDGTAVVTQKVKNISTDADTVPTVAGLPKYDTSGKEYQYQAVETAIPAGAHEYEMSPAPVTTKGDNGVYKTVVTNKLKVETIDLSGTKTWTDEANKYGTRPQQGLTLNVYYKDSTHNTWTLDGNSYPVNWNLNTTTGTWTYTIKNLLKYSPGDAVARTYSVVETVPSGYTRTEPETDEYRTGTVANGGNIISVNFTNKLNTGTLIMKKDKDRGGTDELHTFTVKWSNAAITAGNQGTLYTGGYKVYGMNDDIGTAIPIKTGTTTTNGEISITAKQKFVVTELPIGYYYQVAEKSSNEYEMSDSENLTGQIAATPVIASAFNKATTKLKIENETENPGTGHENETNAGGNVKVIVGGDENPDHPSEDDYKENQVAVVWQPEQYWTYGSALSILYTDFNNNSGVIKIMNYLDRDPINGINSVRSLSACNIMINGAASDLTGLQMIYPHIADQALSLTSTGAVRMALANNLTGMQRQTAVQVDFAPTLAVRNITPADGALPSRHGTVQVENGSPDEASDGLPSDNGLPYAGETTVYGTAAAGYKVDTNKMLLRNMNDLNGTAAQISVGSDGKFATTLSTQIAGVATDVPISGEVFYTYDASGKYVAEVKIMLNNLLIPLQVDLLFVTESTNISGNGDDPKDDSGGSGENNNSSNETETTDSQQVKPKPVNPADGTEEAQAVQPLSAVPRTGDDTPIALIVAIGAGAGIGAFLTRKRKRNKTNEGNH